MGSNESSELNILKSKLKDNKYEYAYVNNIDELKSNMVIKYSKKNNPELKTGTIVNLRDNIIQMKNPQNKRIWYIYYNENYIFIRKNYKNSLKSLLTSFLEADFTNITIKKKKNRDKDIDNKEQTSEKKEKIITYDIPQKFNIQKIT